MSEVHVPLWLTERLDNDVCGWVREERERERKREKEKERARTSERESERERARKRARVRGPLRDGVDVRTIQGYRGTSLTRNSPLL
jgi:hypothetical protein